MPYAAFQTGRIHYTTSGTGSTIVLLHGYLESIDVWKKFIRVLSKEFRVIAIDLPGFGKSDSIAETHSFDLMADAVHAVLKELKVGRCVMIGHSMGGFTALEFADRHPGILAGLGLFHSHPFEDSPEVKLVREIFIETIKTNKIKFLKEYISLLFWDKTIKKYSAQYEALLRSASGLSAESLIATMNGMILRRDTTHVLKNLDVPVLFIIGQQDSRFPVARTWEIIRLAKQSEVLLLRDIAHMGFIEAEAETLKAVKSFAERIYHS